MGNRLSRIYTRTGDDGSTGLGDGTRTAKTGLRIRAIGDVDELNSSIGLLLAEPLPDAVAEMLTDIQHALFDLGGELSMPGQTLLKAGISTQLERHIDAFNADLPALKEFILPAGGRAVALCHMSRAICRRAERAVLRLREVEQVGNTGAIFLNRLSDLLFVCARVLSREAGATEVYWDRQRLTDT